MTVLRNLLLFLVFLSSPLTTAAAATRDPGVYFFQETFGNFQEELAQARQEGRKGVLLFFEQADCPFCHRMKTTVLNQSDVQDYYRKHFRIFSVDIEGDLEVTDFEGRTSTQKDFAFRQFQVRATPVFAFIGLDGKPVTRFTGPTRNAGEFLLLGEYVVDGHYRSETFTQFKRDRQPSAGAE
jgi:thioredoxin-related protein